LRIRSEAWARAVDARNEFCIKPQESKMPPRTGFAWAAFWRGRLITGFQSIFAGESLSAPQFNA
jgi:hypothetical protein